MKKYGLILVIAFLSNYSFSQTTTEYVELSSSKLFNKSFMACYNDDVSYDDLEVLSIKGDKNVHYVIYKGVLTHKVVIIGSDKEGSKREICVNGECDEYDTYATQHEFLIKERTKFTFSNTI
jgi:hypothetical protein